MKNNLLKRNEKQTIDYYLHIFEKKSVLYLVIYLVFYLQCGISKF